MPSQNELNVSTLTDSRPPMARSLFIISCFAFRVNVMASILSGLIDLYLTKNSILFVRTVVLPEHAPAIQRTCLLLLIIAFFCASLYGERKDDSASNIFLSSSVMTVCDCLKLNESLRL